MTTVGEILHFVRQLAPDEMAMDWDTNGLAYGSAAQQAERVLIALDLTLPVVREARECHADLILTHHPFVFTPLRQLNDATPEGRIALALAEGGIATINAHTSLDCAPDGVNDCLARALGLRETAVLEQSGIDAQGRAYGLGRIGTVDECALRDFALLVKTRLHASGVRFADGGRPVHRVAVGGGACGDLMEAALSCGCDTFVTAELKHHQLLLAEALQINLIDAGHFATENVVCPYLEAQLRKAFPNLQVTLSRVHRAPEQFV